MTFHPDCLTADLKLFPKPAQGKTRAIVFVTDHGFLLATLLAARQVIRQTAVVARADVFVLTVGIDKAVARAVEDEFSPIGITFKNLDADLFDRLGNSRFSRSHVPRSTLGRLAIHHVLPPGYEHVVYLDGDIQVVGDIAPLVFHDVKEGFIASANDFLWMYENAAGNYWRTHRAYIAGLGLHDPSGYFNAGVLAFRRSTWEEMAPRALAFFEENSERCLYHDQSALNAVFAGRREQLSLRYNFSTDYALLGLAGEMNPAIIHFSGAAKPWRSIAAPWHGRFIESYVAFAREYPSVAALLPKPSRDEQAAEARALSRSRMKSFVRTPWRHWLRRKAFRRYMRETPFAVR